MGFPLGRVSDSVFNRWRKAGVWQRLLDAVSQACAGDIQMIDGSSRYRNLIERFSNKLKHFRAIATRCDKRDDNLASIQLASIRIRLRFNESVA